VVADRLGMASVAASARHNLGLIRARQGYPEEGISLQQFAVDTFVARKNRYMEGGSRTYLAMILVDAGSFAEAVDEARRAIALMEQIPSRRAHALGVLARALAALGSGDEAVLAATEASAIVESLNGIDEGEELIRLAYAEALEASGKHDAAVAAIQQASERVTFTAGRIADTAWRRSYLDRVPENVRIHELAIEWGVTPPDEELTRRAMRPS
jgi:tetratricopeptide (TPR) repeat protein